MLALKVRDGDIISGDNLQLRYRAEGWFVVMSTSPITVRSRGQTKIYRVNEPMEIIYDQETDQ